MENIEHEVPREKPAAIFSLAWFLVTVGVVLIVAVACFWTATEFGKRADAARLTCAERNKQIEAVNGRFTQLTSLFDAALSHPAPGSVPPSEDLLRRLEALKQPIPQVSCERLK